MTVNSTFLGDLLEAISLGANVLWTILLALCLIYWLFVIIGAVDVESFDVDVDVDVDVDTDIDSGGNSVAWIGFLKFLNLDAIPFMVFFSVFSLSGWAISILFTHYVGQNWMTSIALFIPIVFISLLISKYMTAPLVPLFRGLNDEAKPLDLIGDNGIVIHGFKKGELSQARIKKNNEDLLVSIKIAEESTVSIFEKGVSVTILRKIKEGDMIAYEVIAPEVLK